MEPQSHSPRPESAGSAQCEERSMDSFRDSNTALASEVHRLQCSVISVCLSESAETRRVQRRFLVSRDGLRDAFQGGIQSHQL